MRHLRLDLIPAILLASGVPALAAVTISTAATQNMSCAAGVCAPTAANAVLNANDLETMLATGDVKITTTGATAQATDIRIEAALAWSAATTLSLDANKSVVVESRVDVAGGGLSVATNDGGSGGQFACEGHGRIKFANLAGTLAIDGTNYMLVGSIAELAGAIASNPAGNFALARSYDAGGDGIYAAPPVPTVFSGAFDGLGNTISNLRIDDPTKNSYVGLFAETASGSSIANLRLVGVTVAAGSGASLDSTQEFVGGLVGYGDGGTIASVTASGSIAAGDYAVAGGLVGLAGGVIDRCNSTSSISIGQMGNAGGLVGGTVRSASIADSHSSGTVSGEGYIGGLVGFNYEAPIARSTSAIRLTGTGRYSWAGGLVGGNNGNIFRSSASGAVNCPGSCGGLVGDDNCLGVAVGTISQSYATGNVSANSSTAGGLVASNEGCKIANAYAAGSVSGGIAGGLVGDNECTAQAAVSKSYAKGAVTGLQEAGGSIGYDGYEGSLKRDYWDTTTSGVTNEGQGAGNVVDDPGIKGLSSAKLQSRLPRGFSPRIWAENPSINGGFPYLIANPPPR